MKYVVLAMLAACGPKPPVVTWQSSLTGFSEHVVVRSNGEVRFTSSKDGKTEELTLLKEQVQELAELFRAQHACELTHDPAHVPAPDEGQTTLDIAFPDQRCKVVLWNREWQQGPAREISETMRSLRPLRSHGGR